MVRFYTEGLTFKICRSPNVCSSFLWIRNNLVWVSISEVSILEMGAGKLGRPSNAKVSFG